MIDEFFVRSKVPRGIVIALVGNKTDLDHPASSEEAKQFADEYGILFVETSAKTGMNVDQIFLTISMFFVLSIFILYG